MIRYATSEKLVLVKPGEEEEQDKKIAKISNKKVVSES